MVHSSRVDLFSNTSPSKTVAVLGASYGGYRAAQLIASGLPNGWRVVLIDRNSHANHVYILPRVGVLPGHEHKAFIPYNNVFASSKSSLSSVSSSHQHGNLFLHTKVVSLSRHSVTLSRAFPEHGLYTQTLDFDYLVYALGSHLPSPINLWGPHPRSSNRVLKADHGHDSTSLPYQGTKTEAIQWLKHHQRAVESASSVLVVGGGALGIQYATDVAAVYPHKRITLLHSRHRLLPRFDESMHTEILHELRELNVEVILGERLDLSSTEESTPKLNEQGQRIVRTLAGRDIAADLLLLCTGQKPNTEILRTMDKSTLNHEDGTAHVLRTMQLGVLTYQTHSRSTSVTSIRNTENTATPAPEPAFACAEDAAVDIVELETALEEIALEDMSNASSLGLKTVSERETSVASTSSYVSSSYSPSSTVLSEYGEDEMVEDDEETPYPHIFVIGDAADAFGAINAGHNAYYQAEVAARNILRLIRLDEQSVGELPTSTTSPDPSTTVDDDVLEWYTPHAPAIKVSLGLTKSVYQVNGVVGTNDDGTDDLNTAHIWEFFGMPNAKEEDMFA